MFACLLVCVAVFVVGGRCASCLCVYSLCGWVCMFFLGVLCLLGVLYGLFGFLYIYIMVVIVVLCVCLYALFFHIASCAFRSCLVFLWLCLYVFGFCFV